MIVPKAGLNPLGREYWDARPGPRLLSGVVEPRTLARRTAGGRFGRVEYGSLEAHDGVLRACRGISRGGDTVIC